MKRILDPHTLVPLVVIVAVAAMVGYANWREQQRSRAPFTTAPLIGTGGADRTTREDLERRITAMGRRLTAHPDDVGAAVLLADALLRQTRVTGNVGLSKRAEEVLSRANADDPANYDVNRMLGTLYLSQHRFREAIAIGEKNRDTRPYDPVSYGIIGDGHLELGEYQEAFDAFDRMMTLRPSAPAYARVAYARELQGNLRGALQAMQLAAEATAPQDPEAQAWTYSQVGELYFQMGKLPEAEAQFTLASQAFPGHPFAVIGYARVRAARGDLSGALALVQDLERRAPTPDVAAFAGHLLERLGHHEEAQRQYALAETGWRVDAPEPRNLARFLADRGELINDAVQIAETAAQTRHDIFTLDALAWAYFKAGRTVDATIASREALRTGTCDRVLLYHAAAIKHAAGDDGEARRLVERALDGNVEFDLVSARAASQLRADLGRAPQLASQ